MSCRSSLSFIAASQVSAGLTLRCRNVGWHLARTLAPALVICVLGDAHLDVIVAISGPVAPDTDTPAQTRVSVGGQAANVAAWVSALGGRSRLIAALADDAAAALVGSDLARRGIDLAAPVMAGRTVLVASLPERP